MKKPLVAARDSYEKVDKRWLKCWTRFLSDYTPDSRPLVLHFVIDSLHAELEKLDPPKPAGKSIVHFCVSSVSADIVEAYRKSLYDLIHRDVRFMFEDEKDRLRGLKLLETFLGKEISRIESCQKPAVSFGASGSEKEEKVS
jgi:hypothetical protein